MEKVKVNGWQDLEKGKRLAEAIGKLEKEATDLVAGGLKTSACKALKQKSIVKQAFDKTLERADMFSKLASHLEVLIEREQTQLIQTQA